jgi:hypothetical protein
MIARMALKPFVISKPATQKATTRPLAQQQLFRFCGLWR